MSNNYTKGLLKSKLSTRTWKNQTFYWYTLTIPKGIVTDKTPEDFVRNLVNTFKIQVTSWHVVEFTQSGTPHYHGIVQFWDGDIKPAGVHWIDCWPWRLRVDRLFKYYKMVNYRRYSLSDVIDYLFKSTRYAASYTSAPYEIESYITTDSVKRELVTQLETDSTIAFLEKPLEIYCGKVKLILKT